MIPSSLETVCVLLPSCRDDSCGGKQNASLSVCPLTTQYPSILPSLSSSLHARARTAASRALIDMPDMTAEEVARKSMTIAADMCVHTNHEFLTLTLEVPKEPSKEAGKEPEEKKKSKSKK